MIPVWFILALGFALWTSISIVLVKKLTKTLNVFSFLFINSVVIIVFLFGILIISGGVPHVTPLFFALIGICSMLDAIAFVSSTKAIQTSEISLISPISAFNPLFTTLFAILILQEIPTPINFLGIFIIVCGTYFLNIQDIKYGFLTPFKKLFSNKGVLLFLLANVIWAITPTLQKPAIFQTTPETPVFVSLVGTILVVLYTLPFCIKPLKKDAKKIKGLFPWFLLLGLFAACAQVAAFTAFSQAPVGYVTAIFKLSILFTVIWGIVIFKERHVKERLIGVTIMIIGTILLVL